MPNVNVPTKRVAKNVKQKLTELKGETGKFRIIVGEFYTLLSAINRSIRQNISKDIEAFNNTIDQEILTDTYRIFFPTTAHTFFSTAQEIFFKTDHILDHKTNLNI